MTCGRGWSGCGAAPRPRCSRHARTRARSPSTASGTPAWPALGVSTVFLATPDLAGPDDVLELAGLNA